MKTKTVLSIIFMELFLCSHLFAATVVVNEASEEALRAAINKAVPGDVITFDTSIKQYIIIRSTLILTKPITIQGWENERITLEGSGCPLMDIACNGIINLQNLQLQNGFAKGEDGETLGTGGGGGAGIGGAVYVSTGILQCYGVWFINNRVEGGNGGGTQAQSNGGRGGNACRIGLGSGGAGGRGKELYYGTEGENGKYCSGGGGGAGQWTGVCNAAPGGAGGWAGGGGGGGGGDFTRADGGKGGEFGGDGGWGGLFWTNGGGGGGAGLGGAIFIDSNGGLVLDNCYFRGNIATGGKGSVNAKNGLGKGGAIFAKPNTLCNIYNTKLEVNSASDASGYGFVSNGRSDSIDVYGVVTSNPPTPTPTMTPTSTPTATITPTFTPTVTPTPWPDVVVSTLNDENDGPALGEGISLREAIQLISPSGEIHFSEKILPGTCTINPSLNTIIIDRDVKIVGPGIDSLIVNGNKMRVFFVKRGQLSLDGIRIVNGYSQGGDGGGGSAGAGGAAGMGGAIFVNKEASLKATNMVFENCGVQGGKGGDTNYDPWYAMNLGGDRPTTPETLIWLAGGGGGGIGGHGQNGNGQAWGMGRDPIKIHRRSGNGGQGWPLDGVVTGNSKMGGDGAGGGGSVELGNGGGNGGFGGGGGGSFVEGSGAGGFGGGGSAVILNVNDDPFSGYAIAFGRPNPGGMFGGNGYGLGGGGGSGLGGAIFVRENGTLYLDNCFFKNNFAKGGRGGLTNFLDIYPTPRRSNADDGQGKGGAVFIMDKTTAAIGHITFAGNVSGNGQGTGIRFDAQNDTHDVWGKMGAIYADTFPETIQLTANIPLSGTLAYYGTLLKQDFDLAVNDVNRNQILHKSKLVMNYFDNESSSEKAAQGQRAAMADQNNWAVFCDFSMLSKAIVEESSANQNKTPVFTMATYSGLRQFNENTIKVTPLDSYQAGVIARQINRYQEKNILVLADNSEYGLGILSALEKNPSVSINGKFLYTPGELAADPAKVQAAVDALVDSATSTSMGVIAGYAEDCNAFLKAVCQNPALLYHRWILTDGCIYPSAFNGLSMNYSQNNLFGITPGVAGFLDAAKKNIDFQYEKTYNQKPSWDAAYAYDAVCLCAEMINKISYPKPELLFEQIPYITFTGVSGMKRFDREGELISAVYDIKRVKNGEWVTLGQEKIDQPEPMAFGDYGPPVDTTETISEGFKQWLYGNDPAIGHFWGESFGGGEWKAQSIDMETGWNLIAYYEDTARGKNSDGTSFGFKEGNPYHLSFDMIRQNLIGAPDTGAILDINVYCVSRYYDSSGQENYNSTILTVKSFTFPDWPSEGEIRLDIPIVYNSPEVPKDSSRSMKDNLLYWDIQLMNNARQEIVLKKAWVWAAPPEDGGLPSIDTAVQEWSIF